MLDGFGMPRVTELGALVMFQPQKAREIILDAVRSCAGNVTHAAKRLNVPHRSFCRFMNELGINRDVELIRRELSAGPAVVPALAGPEASDEPKPEESRRLTKRPRK